MSTTHTPFREARQRAGMSLKGIGSALGVNKSTVHRWEANRVPAERVLDVERVTGIPRHELRPDLYPVETSP